MSETAIYIHGTRPEEQERLSLLNRLTNATFAAFLDVQAGTHVLDVGSGLGLLAAHVSNGAPGVRVVGLEQSRDQIAAAVTASRVQYVQGDAGKLPFCDRLFDLAYTRYVLEHVGDPEGVLREMKRVTRSGCRVAVCENDISLLRFDPECPAFDEVWEAFQQHQGQLGGNSLVGRRLYRHFRNAGFSQIELSVQPEIHWHGSPQFADWVTNIIGNVESARQGLIESRLSTRERIDAAVAELSAIQANSLASSTFAWNRAMAVCP